MSVIIHIRDSRTKTVIASAPWESVPVEIQGEIAKAVREKTWWEKAFSLEVIAEEVPDTPGPAPAPAPTPEPAPTPTPPEPPSPVSDLAGLKIKWPSGQNVSEWPVTVNVRLTKTSGGKVAWHEDGDRDSWPVPSSASKPINSNCWTLQPKGDGYVAETFDYVKKGQHEKGLENLHIEAMPKGWGFLIAGITRNSAQKNVKKRSNVDWVK